MADPKVNIIFTAVDQTKAAIGGLTSNLQKLGTIALAGLGGLAGAATGAAAGILLLAKNAEPLVGLQAGFAAVTERIGKGADVMLSALQKASGGLISNRDLMQSFNKAAALVGDDFAERLPDAMGFVQRAAQATGQDMGFLFDSLVTGIGRVSPMILDNLGIQVQLAEVTDRAAQMFGKSTEELTKQEQQAALTEIVMEKLAGAYGDIPAAAQPIAQIGVMFENLKDTIGTKLLPVVQPLAEQFMSLANDALPILASVLDNTIVPALVSVSEFISKFIDGLTTIPALIEEGFTPLEAFGEVLKGFFPPEMAETIDGIVTQVQAFIDTIVAAAEPVIEAIAGFVSMQDVLIALGIAIAATVIPIVISLVTSLLPIILTAAALVAAIAILRNAWENDWLGIRTALTDFWENTGRPIFEIVKEWLEKNIPIAIETLKRFWETVLLPAIQKVWNWLSTVLIPFLSEVLRTWIEEIIPAALKVLSEHWAKMQAAAEVVWDWIDTNLIPLFEVLWELLEVAGKLALTVLAGVWQNILQPALKKVWEFIDANVIPIFEDVWEFIDANLMPIIKDLADFLKNVLAKAWGRVTEAIQGLIKWIGDLIESLKNIDIPDWLMPGSPTPFELGIRGISDAMRELSTLRLPQLKTSLTAVGAGAQAVVGPSNQFFLTAQYGYRSEGDLVQDVNMLQMLYG